MKPVVDLNSPKLMRYTYKSQTKWRTWPRSWKLEEFIAKHDTRTIENIINTYYKVKSVNIVNQYESVLQ